MHLDKLVCFIAVLSHIKKKKKRKSIQVTYKDPSHKTPLCELGQTGYRYILEATQPNSVRQHFSTSM